MGATAVISPLSGSRLLRELDSGFRKTLDLASNLPEKFWHQQFHPDLSPVAWHLGHCGFIESHWIRNELLGDDALTRELESLYLPWLSPKATRGKRIPGAESLLAQLHETHLQNLELLSRAYQTHVDHELLKNNYLSLFLIQHHAQHRETMQQVMLCYHLSIHDIETEVSAPLTAREPVLPDLEFASTTTTVGDCGGPAAYDNELARHDKKLDPYVIARHAVSNAEYLGFMQAGGYDNPACWSARGWQWRQTLQQSAPMHWRTNTGKQWFQVTPTGTRQLDGKKAVLGLSHYEAEAFARYAGCRLPHEHEWEHAVTDKAPLMEWGEAWEWCNNPFYPYPGFRAFPYDGYSKHWFDDSHYTLRGGSPFTSTWIRRPTFRNFYTPEKRHVFAGLRLAK